MGCGPTEGPRLGLNPAWGSDGGVGVMGRDPKQLVLRGAFVTCIHIGQGMGHGWACTYPCSEELLPGQSCLGLGLV